MWIFDFFRTVGQIAVISCYLSLFMPFLGIMLAGEAGYQLALVALGR